MSKPSWTQPICERCWIEAEGVWVSDLATGVEHLSALRFPSRLTEPTIERCSWCGNATIFGAYKRADPRSVPYTAMEDEPKPCPDTGGEHEWRDDPPRRVVCGQCGIVRETLDEGVLP